MEFLSRLKYHINVNMQMNWQLLFFDLQASSELLITWSWMEEIRMGSCQTMELVFL